MKFYFLRHAEDIPDIIGGWSDNPLTNLGMKQIKKTLKYFKTHKSEMDIQHVVSSNLDRAFLTVKPIAEMLGLPVEKAVEWNGLNQGLLNGLHAEEVEERYPFFAINKVSPYLHFPAGESVHSFSGRAIKVWMDLYDKYISLNENVLVCTHGINMGVISAILLNQQFDHTAPSIFVPCTLMTVDTDTKQITYFQIAHQRPFLNFLMQWKNILGTTNQRLENHEQNISPTIYKLTNDFEQLK